MSWAGRIVRFLAPDEKTVLALQPIITNGPHQVWSGHDYLHDCEACELTATVEMLAAAATLGLMPAGRPDPATVRLRPALGLRALASWGGPLPDPGAIVWQHNDQLCPGPGQPFDELLDQVRTDLAIVGDCRQRRQPNCVVARLVQEIDRLSEFAQGAARGPAASELPIESAQRAAQGEDEADG